eukprot:1925230-Pyramimonas_sp.AAC.1
MRRRGARCVRWLVERRAGNIVRGQSTRPKGALRSVALAHGDDRACGNVAGRLPFVCAAVLGGSRRRGRRVTWGARATQRAACTAGRAATLATVSPRGVEEVGRGADLRRPLCGASPSRCRSAPVPFLNRGAPGMGVDSRPFAGGARGADAEAIL